TISMSVRERTREMAILRTLGYVPREILQMVLGESMLVAFLGGLIGIGFTFGLTRAAAAGAAPGGDMFKFHWEASVIIAASTQLIQSLPALVAAYFASRKNI